MAASADRTIELGLKLDGSSIQQDMSAIKTKMEGEFAKIKPAIDATKMVPKNISDQIKQTIKPVKQTITPEINRAQFENSFKQSFSNISRAFGQMLQGDVKGVLGTIASSGLLSGLLKGLPGMTRSVAGSALGVGSIAAGHVAGDSVKNLLKSGANEMIERYKKNAGMVSSSVGPIPAHMKAAGIGEVAAAAAKEAEEAKKAIKSEGLIDKIKALFGGISSTLGPVGSIIAGVAVATIAVFAGAKATMNHLDTQVKEARSLGTTYGMYQSFNQASTLSGLTPEMTHSALGRIQYGLGTESEKSMSALQKLGVSKSEIMGQGDPIAILVKLAKALNQIENPTEKATIAMDLFGRGAYKQMLLLAAGAKGMEAEMSKHFDTNMKLGEMTGTSEAFNDMLSRLGTSIKLIALQIGTSLIPVLDDVGGVLRAMGMGESKGGYSIEQMEIMSNAQKMVLESGANEHRRLVGAAWENGNPFKYREIIPTKDKDYDFQMNLTESLLQKSQSASKVFSRASNLKDAVTSPGATIADSYNQIQKTLSQTDIAGMTKAADEFSRYLKVMVEAGLNPELTAQFKKTEEELRQKTEEAMKIKTAFESSSDHLVAVLKAMQAAGASTEEVQKMLSGSEAMKASNKALTPREQYLQNQSQLSNLRANNLISGDDYQKRKADLAENTYGSQFNQIVEGQKTEMEKWMDFKKSVTEMANELGKDSSEVLSKAFDNTFRDLIEFSHQATDPSALDDFNDWLKGVYAKSMELNTLIANSPDKAGQFGSPDLNKRINSELQNRFSFLRPDNKELIGDFQSLDGVKGYLSPQQYQSGRQKLLQEAGVLPAPTQEQTQLQKLADLQGAGAISAGERDMALKNMYFGDDYQKQRAGLMEQLNNLGKPTTEEYGGGGSGTMADMRQSQDRFGAKKEIEMTNLQREANVLLEQLVQLQAASLQKYSYGASMQPQLT